MTKIYIVLLLFTLSALAAAESYDATIFHTGTEFLNYCSEIPDITGPTTPELVQRAVNSTYCMGWVSGFAGSYMLAPQPVCIPEQATHGQIFRVVQQYIEQHPKRANERIEVLTAAALRDAFPCEKGK